MYKIKNHTNGNVSIEWNDCTIYGVTFYEDSVGIATQMEFLATSPKEGVVIYLFQGYLNLKEDEKIYLNEDNTLFIRRNDGTSEELKLNHESLGMYYFNEDKSTAPTHKMKCNIMKKIRDEGIKEEEQLAELFRRLADDYIKFHVYFHNERVDLTTFNDEPCLWITNKSGIYLPHMIFLGGYPDEYGAFLKDFTQEDEEYLCYWNKKPAKIKELCDLIKKD